MKLKRSVRQKTPSLFGSSELSDLEFLVNNLLFPALRQPEAAVNRRPSGVPKGWRVVSGGFGWGVAIS